MHKSTWRFILLCLLLLTVVLVLSGCQASRSLENFTRAISSIPSRVGDVIIDIMGGIGDVGKALADQVGNAIKNMTGR